MRRKSQGDGWGFVPVLRLRPLFPKRLVSRFTLKPTALMDVLTFAGIDVVISRKALAFRRHSFGIFRKIDRIPLHQFIGVAVHYTPAPTCWEFSDLLRLDGYRAFIPHRVKSFFSKKLLPSLPVCTIVEKLQTLFAVDIPFSEQEEGVVSLYLLHEDRSKDVLLYYADHEDEIQALWKFWSSRFRLPQLLVAPDGFIDEPFQPAGTVEIRSPQPRKPFYNLNRRGPHFLRVRDVGVGVEVHRRSKRIKGREISARS